MSRFAESLSDKAIRTKIKSLSRISTAKAIAEVDLLLKEQEYRLKYKPKTAWEKQKTAMRKKVRAKNKQIR